MRIALVSESSVPVDDGAGQILTGQGVHVAALAAALSRRGHETTVYTRRVDSTSSPRVQTKAGYVVESLPAGPPRPLSRAQSLPYLAEFAGALRDRLSADPCDVVHAHYWTSAVAAMQSRAELSIPVVVTFHSLGVVERRHSGAADPGPPARVQIESRLCGTADHVIATCADEVFELRRLGLPVTRNTIVPCGVDITSFTSAGPRPLRPDTRARLLVVGQLVHPKGIEDAIRALRLLPGVELAVAGGPDHADVSRDSEARRLSSVAAACGVRDRVTFLGAVNRRSMPRLIRSADVVVATPSYEAFGMVALEAMACGVPVVASAVGSLTDIVLDGVTGILVPPRDPAAIADAARRIIDDPAFAARLARAGADRAGRRYSWDIVARGTVSVYQEVCNMAVDEPEPNVVP
jgi:D-inositol-3-phosphate glycosyltransferase